MITSDEIRFYLLAATSVTFFGFAVWAAFRPTVLSSVLGFELKLDNAHSEFHAIYVGVFMAQALLCVLAASRIGDSLLGDLCASFLLLQPVGRTIAILRGHWPSGLLRLLFYAELLGGIALLVIRPA